MDNEDKILLEAGDFPGYFDKYIDLKDGERVVGIKSLLRRPGESLWCGLTLVIGYLV